MSHTATAQSLVMLHGWALNLRVFDGLVSRLTDAHVGARVEIIRLDLPGHGRAREPTAWQQPSDRAWEIGEVADHLLAQMPERAVVLGWSLGAKLALEIAVRAPERVTGLILVSATPKFAATADWPHGAPAARLDALAAALRSDYRRTVSDFLSLQVRGSAEATSTLDHLRRALLDRGECPPDVLLRALRLLHEVDQRTSLSRIATPTLVIAGAYDRVVHPEASRALAQRIPGARYVELPRCGHAPFLSHESDVVDLVREFLGADARSTS